MRKNITTVLAAFINGKSKTEGSCRTDGERIYSYNMIIAERHPWGIWMASLNDSPSATTSGHIRAVHSEFPRSLAPSHAKTPRKRVRKSAKKVAA